MIYDYKFCQKLAKARPTFGWKLFSNFGISIAWEELFPLVVACHLQGSTFSNKHILFFCDNQSVVKIVNSKQSCIPGVMDLVHHLTIPTLEYHFYLKVSPFEGKGYEIPDSLSCFQMERFHTLAPCTDLHPCPILKELWKI